MLGAVVWKQLSRGEAPVAEFEPPSPSRERSHRSGDRTASEDPFTTDVAEAEAPSESRNTAADSSPTTRTLSNRRSDIASATSVADSATTPSGRVGTDGAVAAVDSDALVVSMNEESGLVGETASQPPTPEEDLAGEAEAGESSEAPAENAEESEVPRAIIAGRVTDTSGLPVAGVLIVAETIAASGETMQQRAAEVITRGDGEYELTVPAEGAVLLSAIPPAGTFYSPGRTKIITLGDDRLEIRGQDFLLDRGESILGFVVDRDDRPLAGARVAWTIGGETRRTVSGTDGGFFIQGIPTGGKVDTIRVSLEGYQPQTRENITPEDGDQVFKLRGDNSIVLFVSWELDGLPVEMYAYRLMRLNPLGVWTTAGRQEIFVETLDGRTELEDLVADEWRVEVTVLDPEGEKTNLRGSAEFELTEGAEGREIPISVSGGGIISGYTLLNEADGEPLADVTLDFVPPSEGFGRFPPPDAPFQFPTAVSDESGHFQFPILPPGRYTLRARRDDLLAPEAIDVEIPWSGNPQPLRIVMIGGGKVSGKVIGQDGEPAPGARLSFLIQSPNADGWLESQSATSDEQGAYLFEGLPSGSHYIWVYWGGQLRDSVNFNLGAGEEKTIDFDLSDRVRLTGVVYLNGEPAFPHVRHIMFVPQDANSAQEWFVLGTDGSYEARVQPGTNYLRFSNGPPGQPDPVTVSAEPREQTLDLFLNWVPADVVLEFPEGTPFVEGDLVISPRHRSLRYSFLRYKMEQKQRHIPQIFTGEYQATWTARDGDWYAETDWIQLGQGRENVFRLPVKRRAQGERVGGWAPGQVSNIVFQTLTFDVTDYVQGAENLEILVLYEGGRHAVETQSVVLRTEAGDTISADVHPGWSGVDQWNNTYDLTRGETPVEGKLLLDVTLRTDGGTDSTGSVYLSVL